jgi:glycosyltransferase involved in cell wall biosynthesis
MISAIVPTLQAGPRLTRNLDTLCASLRAAATPFEVIVVDDGGGHVPRLQAPLRALRLETTRGYGPAVNAAAAVAAGDHLLVLNDDVRLDRECAGGLLRHFPDPRLFAVVPSIRSPLAACGDEGGKAGIWHAGLLELRERQNAAPAPALYPVGCCFLCPTELFRELGGYDDRYAPFLWEDDPGQSVDHEGSATLRERHTLDARERQSFRNRVLFHLKNIQDPPLRDEMFGALAAYALFESLEPRREGLQAALASDTTLLAAGGLGDAAILAQIGPA